MDAMALVQEFGKQDLLIAMTCKPEWPEIQEELFTGQLAQDRPNLVTRVFRAKLKDLKDQIIKKEIFGSVAAHVFVVEFQKRGLPHIHLLLIFKEGHKIASADQYDRYISAELSDKDKYPKLNEVVIMHHMHGPYGQKHTKCCMMDGQSNVRSRCMIALAPAASGVAATILPGGRTTRSRFEIPLQTNDSTITYMSKQDGTAKLIREAKLIIWDQAPMAKRHIIETVHRNFRDIMDNDLPFGGKVMVFGDDFRQVLPVVPKSTRADSGCKFDEILYVAFNAKDSFYNKYESKNGFNIQ
ncbi:hypothetical protein FXO37_26634 [Capsicum annuum]|nr:hypothetical protein FXO37_26634 [Capsicum annuum]